MWSKQPRFLGLGGRCGLTSFVHCGHLGLDSASPGVLPGPWPPSDTCSAQGSGTQPGSKLSPLLGARSLTPALSCVSCLEGRRHGTLPNHSAKARLLGGLECNPIHQEVMGSVPSQHANRSQLVRFLPLKLITSSCEV